MKRSSRKNCAGDDGNLGAHPDRLRGAEDGRGDLRDGGAVRRRAGASRRSSATASSTPQRRSMPRSRPNTPRAPIARRISAPKAARSRPIRTNAGGSVFMPLMAGFMMGQMMGGRALHAAALPLGGRQQELPHREQPLRRRRDRAHAGGRTRGRASRPEALHPAAGRLRRAGAGHRVPRRRLMERLQVRPRDNWREVAEEHGFTFHTPDGERYWDETHAYRFTLREIEDGLEDPAEELEQMCFEVVERAVADEEVLRTARDPGDVPRLCGR